MFGLGIQELIIILVIVVLIFGAGKLPELGSGIGKGIKNFRDAVKNDDNKKLDNDKSEESDDTTKGLKGE
ncbi:MAG: twin-arginine translocase TatA/TatE family subunit [Deltaproteobacteria bacterium]|nr:MAG: twin-arginine translocase TatA/TatE family subunit [Deltaproteobacteria bacterium]